LGAIGQPVLIVSGCNDTMLPDSNAYFMFKHLKNARYVLVGHSMGGKLGQIVAARRPKELVGVVLVAPSRSTPMPVPEAVRAIMLQSYGSREGVFQALAVLGGEALHRLAFWQGRRGQWHGRDGIASLGF
jgi:pimeloyl-ACP methyl ester carboxylesterase